MKRAIIRLLDKRVVTLDDAVKEEISHIVDALTECEPIDIAVDISDLEYFDGLDSCTICDMICEEIEEYNSDILEKLEMYSEIEQTLK